MRAFRYEAFTEDGARKRGAIVAETEAAAAAQLRGQGLFVSTLEARKDRAGSPAIRRGALNADLQAVFTRQLAVLLGAGMSADAALEAVRQGGHKRLETAAARARAALMDGATLSEALEASGAGFPAFYLASVAAGERAGNVAGVFGELADFLERQGQDKAQISTALIYPAFVAAVSLLVCAILMVNVAPEIVRMFAMTDRPLPQITQVVLAISNWIQANIALIGIAAAAMAGLALASRVSPALARRRLALALRLPVVARFMAQEAAVQYLRTLALVLASRNTVPNAAQSAARVLHVPAFRAAAEAAVDAIGRGSSLGEALRTLPFVPPVAHQLIAAGEASARLAPMADRAAQMVEHGLVTERARIAAILEPALMMLIGALVLTIVLAVLLPIFDLQAVVTG